MVKIAFDIIIESAGRKEMEIPALWWTFRQKMLFYQKTGSIMKPISLELVLHDEVYKLLDGFAALMRLHAVFFSVDGRSVKSGRDEDISRYCELVQDRFFRLDVCLALDEKMQRAAARCGTMLCYGCHAGLKEVIAPVRVGDRLAGFFMFGQYRSAAAPPDFIRDDAETLAAWEALPLIGEEEEKNLLDMLRMLIDYIVKHEFIAFDGDRRMQRIEAFLRSRYAEPVTLKQLARHLACSESTLTHYLHRAHHTTFKQLLTGFRLDAAEALMKAEPELALAEIALRVGYPDSHYFSRVYRKTRGRPPGEFRSEGHSRPNAGKIFG